MIILRPYQQAATQSVLDYWQTGGGNPLVEMATGTGKSAVIASLTKTLVTEYKAKVLMLVHSRELVAQNHLTLLRNWPNANSGIYSAGLGRKDAHHPVTFASIQSVFRKARSLGHRDVILIDEAHLVPSEGEGMYKRMIDDLKDINPDLRVAGFTATPYRLDSGRLDGEPKKGETKLFDKTVYRYGISQGINEGFLSRLISPAGLSEVDVSDIARRGGDFVVGKLELECDKIIIDAVNEMHKYARDRKSWLVFCAGVKNAFNTRDALRASGISCETITGDTPLGERDSILRRKKNGEIRALTNANVLTTGFDDPTIDMIAMLRPTLSKSLYTQMLGRGTRLYLGKENCMALDFSGNIRRHGPVDAEEDDLNSSKGKSDEGKAKVGNIQAKECPSCHNYAAINAVYCKNCDHEWPRDDKPKHDPVAEKKMGILSTETIAPQALPVVNWIFSRWQKEGSPDSVRVKYIAGLNSYHEWLPIEHIGYASDRSKTWWSNHGGAMPFPKTVDDIIDRQGELKMPATICVKKNGKFFEITNRTFNTIKKVA